MNNMATEVKSKWIIPGLVLLIVGCHGLRLTNMTAPALQDPRKDMKLHCSFDMGTETLYAVKWYKDDQEFFRYTPTASNPMTHYPVVGVQVNPDRTHCTSHACDLLLTMLERPYSSGAYRCEVSSEAPAFRLAAGTHNVTVAAVPEEPPRIGGLSETYNLGDSLIAECTSGLGDPKPTLAFFINKQWVPSHPLAESSPPKYQKGRLKLRTNTVQMRIILDRGYSKNKPEVELEVTCNSSVEGISPVVAPPLSTSKRVRLVDPTQVVKNQKLASFLGGGGSALVVSSGLLATLIGVVANVALRW